MIGQAERILELRKLQGLHTGTDSQKIFTFVSGKGGTGKTFLSLNLAYALAEQGKKILYLDIDTNFSNANIMLNVVAKKTIYDVFMERKLLKDVITIFNPNLHFVFGDSGKLNYPELHEGIIAKLFAQISSLHQHYDYIFIDTGTGVGDSVMNILSKSNSVIIVTSPEPTAVMDSYVILKLLASVNYEGDKLIIVNKCITEEDGQMTFKNLSTAAGHFLKDVLSYLGDVNFDMQVNQSIIAQELLLEKHPELPISKQIRNLTGSLTEFTHMANIHQKQLNQL